MCNYQKKTSPTVDSDDKVDECNEIIDNNENVGDVENTDKNNESNEENNQCDKENNPNIEANKIEMEKDTEVPDTYLILPYQFLDEFIKKNFQFLENEGHFYVLDLQTLKFL